MKPRIVLDTNILLDLFYFKDKSAQELYWQITQQKVDVYTCTTIWDEFEEVLARKPFLQTPAEIMRIHTKYTVFFIWLDPQHQTTRVICSDPDDQIFIDLAAEVAPCHLITKDKDLLKLSRKLSLIRVQTAQVFESFGTVATKI